MHAPRLRPARRWLSRAPCRRRARSWLALAAALMVLPAAHGHLTAAAPCPCDDAHLGVESLAVPATAAEPDGSCPQCLAGAQPRSLLRASPDRAWPLVGIRSPLAPHPHELPAAPRPLRRLARAPPLPA